MASRKPDRPGDKPLDIRLSLTVNFGDRPEDAVQIIPERRLKFAGNVFLYRDRIIRFLLFNTLKAATEQPDVYRELLPSLSLLGLLRRPERAVMNSSLIASPESFQTMGCLYE